MRKSRLAEHLNTIISKYRDEHLTMEQIALHYGVSRQYIYKLIRKSGIDTTKHKRPVPCSCCGTEILKHRCQIRNRTHHFCSQECYYAWVASLSEGPYVENRNSQRLARFIVSQHFPLQPNHIVHHKDKNNFNNDPDNLLVFASPGDHIKHHRGIKVVPLWEG